MNLLNTTGGFVFGIAMGLVAFWGWLAWDAIREAALEPVDSNEYDECYVGVRPHVTLNTIHDR